MSSGKGLGKGLSALFGEENIENSAVSGIKIVDIEPNPNQPRRNFDEASLNELAESIRVNGVITPITVRKTGETYQIIAGERRWRASRRAGLNEIPAFVLDVGEKETFVLAMIENLQRSDLNPIEEAEGYRLLMEEFSLGQDAVAEKVGKSRPAITNALRLLGLPERVRIMVTDGELSAGHARAILGLEEISDMVNAADTVKAEQLSVRDTERLVKRIMESKREKKGRERESSIYIEALQRDLSDASGHKIVILHGKKRGKLTIEYYGTEDLEKICDTIKKMGEN